MKAARNPKICTRALINNNNTLKSPLDLLEAAVIFEITPIGINTHLL